MWLAPVQLRVIPVKNEFHLDYAKEVVDMLAKKGFRVELDDRDEKLGYRIREAQLKKIPYQLVLGNQERDEKTVTYREYGHQKQTTLPVDDFIEMIEEEVRTKALHHMDEQ